MYATAFSEWPRMRVMPQSSISASARRSTASMKKTCVTPYAASVCANSRAPVIFRAMPPPSGNGPRERNGAAAGYCPDRAAAVSIERGADRLDARPTDVLLDQALIRGRARDRAGVDARGGPRRAAHVLGLRIRAILQPLAPARIALAGPQHQLQALGTAEVIHLLDQL